MQIELNIEGLNNLGRKFKNQYPNNIAESVLKKLYIAFVQKLEKILDIFLWLILKRNILAESL